MTPRSVAIEFITLIISRNKRNFYPILGDITAETWLRMGPNCNIGYEAEQIREKVETYGADGMVFGFFDFDRWLGGSHRLLARMVEEKCGLPTFYIEGDTWEDRDYSPEALRTRIESICEVIKMRKD